MNDVLNLVKKYINKAKNFWKSRTKKQKNIYLGSAAFLILVIAISTYFATKVSFVPLYSNLQPDEAGSVVQALDSKGVKSELTDGGTTIDVPSGDADSLKVELASEGIPKTGSIDYSFFTQNAGLGTTDNEFNMIKLDAMQTELSNLIEQIDGVQNAKVMINLPDQGVFVSDKTQPASASVVLTIKPGYQFTDQQINGLYQLVSKSVPNLPTSNIVIMNQYFEYYDQKDSESDPTASAFTTDDNIKKQIEQEIQQQVETMLDTLMGPSKAVVSVSADIDFTQEKTQEDLVEPVDKQNMQGIAISAENIKQTFTGNGAAQAGGTPQSASSTVSLGSSYVSGGNNSNGNYEETDDKVNYDVNQIHNQIVQSPYKIRDLGIQVLVEPPVANNPKSLPTSTVNDIKSILGTIVRTSIDKSSLTQPLTNQDLNNKINVSVLPFNGMNTAAQQTSSIPWWAYVLGGLLAAGIAAGVWAFIRSRRRNNDDFEEIPVQEPINVPNLSDEKESATTIRRKQLEKMAKEQPEDFAKLLRTWIAED